MFDAQTAALIRQAPSLEGVDPALLPQELTAIYAELAGIRLRAATLDIDSKYRGRLERVERIATVYEALVDNGADGDERRAAAFVAGTAYQVLGRIIAPIREREELLTTQAIDPRVSAPLLFLIAEQSPDAREAARGLSGPRLQDIHRSALIESIEDLALERLEPILERAERLASLRPLADAPFQERATQALYGLCWSGLIQLVAGLLERDIPALTFQRFDTPQAAFDRVVGLSTRTIALPDTSAPTPDTSAPTIVSSYAGPRHLARLLRNVADMLGGAGITRLPPPAGADAGLWRRWIRHRAATNPSYSPLMLA